MREFVECFFTATTADDQMNCFSGELGKEVSPFYGTSQQLPPGTYRVIDGSLYRIVSGLPNEDLRSIIKSVTKINK
jgi:hypothetical protein